MPGHNQGVSKAAPLTYMELMTPLLDIQGGEQALQYLEVLVREWRRANPGMGHGAAEKAVRTTIEHFAKGQGGEVQDRLLGLYGKTMTASDPQAAYRAGAAVAQVIQQRGLAPAIDAAKEAATLGDELEKLDALVADVAPCRGSTREEIEDEVARELSKLILGSSQLDPKNPPW